MIDRNEEAAAIIEKWRSRTFDGSSTTEEFMERMADRAFVFCGVEVPTDDKLKFVLQMRSILSFAKEIEYVDS